MSKSSSLPFNSSGIGFLGDGILCLPLYMWPWWVASVSEDQWVLMFVASSNGHVGRIPALDVFNSVDFDSENRGHDGIGVHPWVWMLGTHFAICWHIAGSHQSVMFLVGDLEAYICGGAFSRYHKPLASLSPSIITMVSCIICARSWCRIHQQPAWHSLHHRTDSRKGLMEKLYMYT